MIPNNPNTQDNSQRTGNDNNNANGRLDEKLRTGGEDYKNIETAVNNPNYFDDDYAVKQENKIGQDEAKSEKDDRVGRGE